MVHMCWYRLKELRLKRALRRSRRRSTLSSRRDLAISASETASSPLATSPGSSSGPNTSPFKDKNASFLPESRSLPPLPSSLEPSTRTRLMSSSDFSRSTLLRTPSSVMPAWLLRPSSELRVTFALFREGSQECQALPPQVRSQSRYQADWGQKGQVSRHCQQRWPHWARRLATQPLQKDGHSLLLRQGKSSPWKTGPPKERCRCCPDWR